MRPAGWPVTLHANLFAHLGSKLLGFSRLVVANARLPVLPGSSYLANRAATHCCPGHTVAGKPARHREAALVAASSPSCWSTGTGSRQTTWRNVGEDGCCLLVILTPAPPPQISLRSWTGLYQLSSLLVSATIQAPDHEDCLD